MFIVFFTYALFGSVFTVGKLALSLAPPFFLTGARYLIAGVILFLYELFKGRIKGFCLRTYLPYLISVAVFSVFLTNGLEFWGMQYLSSSKTCLFYSMSPFFSVVLAYFILGERMTLKKWIGLLIGIVGFVALVIAKDPGDVSTGSSMMDLGSFSLPEIAVTTSAFVSIVGWSHFKKLTVNMNFSATQANAYSFLIAGVVGLVFSYFTESMPVVANDQELFTLIWQVAYITLIHSVICYSLYGQCLKRFSVTFMAFAGISNPVFAAIYGAIFLGEQISAAFIACVILVSIGLFFFYLDEKKAISASKS